MLIMTFYKFEMIHHSLVTKGGNTQNYYIGRVLSKPGIETRGYKIVESKSYNKELYSSSEALDLFYKLCKKYVSTEDRTGNLQRPNHSSSESS